MITTYEHEQIIKEYPTMNFALLMQHNVDEDVHHILFEKNTPVKGLSFKRGYFKIMGGWYVHYLLQHSVVDVEMKGVALKLLKVQLYDTFIEYEAARVKTLQEYPPDQQWGLNLN